MVVVLGWMKIMVILTGLFTLAGEGWIKKTWKHRIMTLLVVLLCVFVRAVSFENPGIRYVLEVSILCLYIAFYCKKELGHHFMYLLIVYVILDVASILGALISFVLQGCSPGENYQIWRDGTIIVIYVSLFCMFLVLQKRPRRLPRKKGFSIAEAGMTLLLLFAEVVVVAFVASDDKRREIYPLYAFSFFFAVVICALWMLDKKMEEKRVRELVRYEHRMREVLPTVGRALKKMEDLSENSEETAKIMAELKAVCRADREMTQAEIFSAKTFAPTGSTLFDSMLEEYLGKAAQEGVKVDVIVRARIDALFKEQKIEIGLFLQMFGDLYRNAEKAVLKQEGGGRILICMGYNQEAEYEISLSDNGAMFPKYILERLGERGVTTDGTGHGLADVFLFMDKYGVSFFLDQNLSSQAFTKTVRLIFDGKGRRL